MKTGVRNRLALDPRIDAARAIELRGVTRMFERRPALIRVDLDVGVGEVLLIRGANGAGKSTLLRIIATVSAPSEGVGRVLGLDMSENRVELRRRLEYVGHATRLYEELTARENLTFVARLYGVPTAAIDDALSQVGMLRAADLRVSAFSQGMRQRLALARIVLRRPELLLLDEPFAGLDAGARQATTSILSEAIGYGATVVLASHDGYADDYATRTIELAHGRIVHDVHDALRVAR